MPGLGSGLPVTGFPEFEQFCSPRFQGGTQAFKSLASTNSATPALIPIYQPPRWAQMVILKHVNSCDCKRLSWRGGPIAFRLYLWPPHIDDRGVDHILDVRGIEFLDHLHAGAAVLGDLVDVGAFHQPHADIGLTEAFEGAALPFSVELQLLLVEDGVEQFAMGSREDQIGLRRATPLPDALERKQCAGYALAEADALLPAHIDFKDRLAAACATPASRTARPPKTGGCGGGCPARRP